MVDLIIDIPEWMSDMLQQAAALCEKSVDDVAVSFFGHEVVHTSKNFNRGVVHT